MDSNPGISRDRATACARITAANGEHAATEAHSLAGRDGAPVDGAFTRDGGNLEEAAARHAAALEHAPGDALRYNDLGETRRAQGHLAEAVALFRRALDLAPDAAVLEANLGSALLEVRRPDLALAHLQHATTLDPMLLAAFSDLAICLCSLNRYAESLPVYRHIYRMAPNANDARYLEALALLATGDFENGWRKHEVRWYAQLGQAVRRVVPGAVWRGGPPARDDDLDAGGVSDAERTLLVHAEQGHGDTVQFLRYIPLLRGRVRRVILEVQPGLKPLLAGWPDVFARGEDLPLYDMQCSFMSLPRAFRTTLPTIPATVPYLAVPPDRLAYWRQRLGAGDGRRRIALAWSGTSLVWNRSIPLRLLEPLLSRRDCVFHVVQTEMEPDDRACLDRLPHLVDHSTTLTDFADTASVVALMDMVISVDTVLAHLGGALAKPTWTMLPFGAEYRWLTEGATSPWYPTMRLFRQPELNAWPLVVAAVNAALSE